MKIMSFLAGAFAGAVVGATAALLLAPTSGEHVREQARERYETLIADARRAAEEKQEQLKAQLEALKAPKTMTNEQ
ncbi:MAG: YtxH domain-containing protein [Chloroflexi bacterium]|nr:YtxH domain-containing protein [Chloroflexota bacterium]